MAVKYEPRVEMSDEKKQRLSKPKYKNQLTEDQRGWAKARHPEHFKLKRSRWYIDPQKPSVPIPAVAVKE